MHKSRLGTIVIDCQGVELDSAADFWSRALGRSVTKLDDPSNANYRVLQSSGDEVQVLVQAVEHPSRVHLDIETDDIDAEVARLEALGAYRVAQVKQWWVMQAPTGQRFCIVRPQRPAFEEGANEWPDLKEIAAAPKA
jgi:predicted enzyme related to lactoylglutathione lyase